MDWRELERAADRAALTTFGESVRLSFLKNGTVDPTRPMLDTHGLLHVGGDDSASNANDSFRTRLSGGEAELFLDRASYAGPAPRPDDRVRANDRDGTPWFAVTAVSDRYSSLIVLTLYEA
ncbi:hypothetical protein [Aurantimonas coralicida]|uniref:hypothetical protein n=1 Tax=Aurantimonas coralicida TaxID=182270 RepID=UPI001E5C5748|nr:hypothetical protein [Aurantimonas coralicida]MCD1642467.1 hypothetical protein [Aurantimonas coralicida]